MSLFTSALVVCSVAGAGGPLNAVIVGAMLEGKPVVEALKAITKRIKNIGS